MELQENASLVETDLSGGNHSYLGLALIDKDYNSIPNTVPFVPPHCLAHLAMPPIAITNEGIIQ